MYAGVPTWPEWFTGLEGVMEAGVLLSALACRYTCWLWQVFPSRPQGRCRGWQLSGHQSRFPILLSVCWLPGQVSNRASVLVGFGPGL